MEGNAVGGDIAIVLGGRGAADRGLRAADDAPLRPGLAVLELETPHGPARAHLHGEGNDRGALVLGHGAGGSVDAPDLVAAHRGRRRGRVQRRAGRTALQGRRQEARSRPPRSSTRPGPRWSPSSRNGELEGLPLITGGRSAGARVACRTARRPPAPPPCSASRSRPSARQAREARQSELDAVELPALVVQGESDPFGMPTGAGPQGRHRSRQPRVKKDIAAVAAAVGEWLPGVIAASAEQSGRDSPGAIRAYLAPR